MNDPPIADAKFFPIPSTIVVVYCTILVLLPEPPDGSSQTEAGGLVGNEPGKADVEALARLSYY